MKKTWHEHYQRKMTPLFLFSLLVKLSEEIIAQFTYEYFGCWFKIMFCRFHGNCFIAPTDFHGNCFVAPIEVTSAAVALPRRGSRGGEMGEFSPPFF